MTDATNADLIPVPLAARLAGVSQRTIWARAAAGDLESSTIGSRRLISRASVEQYKAKKVLKLQSTFQSSPDYDAVVDEIIGRLRPLVTEMVKELQRGK